METQGWMFDDDLDAIARRDAAVKVVEKNANEAWIAAAAHAVVIAAAHCPDGFTSDDAAALMPDGITIHDRRAWGPVFLRAARRGLIRQTGAYRRSTDARCHARPKAVWISINIGKVTP